MGIVIIILGAKLHMSEIFKNSEEGSSVEEIGRAAFIIMIIFASLAILAGVLGIITANCNKKKICIGCFAFWSLIIGALFLVAGAILFAVGSASDEVIDEFCAGKMDYSEYFADTIADIDEAMGNTTAKYMCTDYCPCPYDLDRKLWTNETRANVFNRTTYYYTDVNYYLDLSSNY